MTIRSKTREERRSFALEQDLRHLVPIAQRLARRSPDKLTVENVRLAAENAQILFAFNDRAYLARLFSLVMRRAGLHRVPGQYVRTARIGRRGGNLVSVWRRAA